MGIACNLAVATFGETAPFIIAALIDLTDDDTAIAYHLMAVAAAGRRPPVPARISRPAPARVDAQGGLWGEVTRKLVEKQDNNPLLDLDSPPFKSSFAIARAAHRGRPGKPKVMGRGDVRRQ